MIAWAVVVALPVVGIVVLPKRRERILFAVLLGLIAVMAAPPILEAYRKHDHAVFVVFHLRPTKDLLSLIRTDVEAGRTNAALMKIDTALSDWDELQTRGTNRTVRTIVERIEKGSEPANAAYRR